MYIKFNKWNKYVEKAFDGLSKYKKNIKKEVEQNFDDFDFIEIFREPDMIKITIHKTDGYQEKLT